MLALYCRNCEPLLSESLTMRACSNLALPEFTHVVLCCLRLKQHLQPKRVSAKDEPTS